MSAWHRGLLAVAIVTGFCHEQGLAAPGEPAKPKAPAVEAGFVGNPEFQLRSGSFSAGTAFLINFEGETNALLVTAQHLFGPSGGLKEEVARDKMAETVRRVNLRDLVKGKSMFTKVAPLSIKDEEIDAAVFRTSLGPKVKPRTLAKESPMKGDEVWLVASLGERGRGKILHRGTVDFVFQNVIRCKLDESGLEMRGASGAPYLDSKGDVVGLHTGSFRDSANKTVAILPASIIKEAIRAALAP